MNQPLDPYWSWTLDQAFRAVDGSPEGLSSEEARDRLRRYGPNALRTKRNSAGWQILLSQFKSPLIVILIAAAMLSLFLHDPTDASIILTIVLISSLLGFWQERGATNAVEKLIALVQVRANVRRSGAVQDIAPEDVVPGDIVILTAGSTIPADCVVFEATALFVDEATLTGETLPVEKAPGAVDETAPLGQRFNTVFMGTHVVSGSAVVLVVRTGQETEFGGIFQRLRLRPPETDFERGLRQLGSLLMQVTVVMLALIFGLNVFFHRPVVDAFLFALALAVGITPQLLPAIVTINLSRGAKQMAQVKVIVKRLFSIENFGRMDVLCADKTGTLTTGTMSIVGGYDLAGRNSDAVLAAAYLNASFETGFVNPIDAAIRQRGGSDLAGCEKLAELPYDFVRKRLSVLITQANRRRLITKGAVPNVLAACTRALDQGELVELASVRERIERQFATLSAKGLRTIAVAERRDLAGDRVDPSDESEMTFLGFLALEDPIKSDAKAEIEDLKSLGVGLKVITGDNRLVARAVLRDFAAADERLLTGSEIRTMSDEALLRRVGEITLFAEVEPNQKERIIRSLQKAGYVVGYVGDGINDASALHAADVGISVDTAVDVAKEAADLVLLDHNLGVISNGVRRGRQTFANTLKYVFMAVGANFGNVFSMAGASLILPFLPLLPKQILLANLVTDLPAMAIATDHVDPELTSRPRHWDTAWIKKFMWTFGPLSSIFDFLTFGVLMLGFHADEHLFRTAWFMESVVSAVLVVLVLRSRRPFWQSAPSRYLFSASLAVVGFTIALPFSPVARPLGFVPPSWPVLVSLAVIVSFYMAAAESVKRRFFHRTKF